MKITVQGQPNATYTVEATDSFSSPVQWIAIGNATANAAGQFTFTDADAPQHPIRFYRFLLAVKLGGARPAGPAPSAFSGRNLLRHPSKATQVDLRYTKASVR
jgi:hypothetical protein